MPAQPRLRRDDGMALIAVMLLLMCMSALAAALAISSTTETIIARNHQTAAQARTAAEAGLTHAIDVALDFLSTWPGSYTSASDAISDMLDPGIAALTVLETPVALAGTGTSYSSISYSGGSFASVRYEAMVLDDDDEVGRDLTLSDDDVTRMGEDGDPTTDTNSKFIVRAIGYAGGNAVAAVEATIAPSGMPGLLTDGDLNIGGNFAITGAEGSVHTNGDFTHNGNSWTTTQGCTASAGTDTGTDCPAGSSEISVPDKSADDYLSTAQYILHDDGEMTTVSTGVKAACSPCGGGWTFSSGTWSVGSGITAGSYYVDGDVALGGNANITIFTTGSVTGNGGTITPYLSGITIVADGDLALAGNPQLGGSGANEEGLILIGEQIDLQGNVTIYGQVIVRNATTASSVVTANDVKGSVVISYSGGLSDQFFAVSAWRRSF